MGRYKILFLDMDGTTLRSDHTFPAETTAAIDDMRARGYTVSLATGRGMSELKDYANEQKHLDYGVIMSGGAVYDFVNRKTLFSKPLPLDVALKIIDVGEKETAMVHILTVDEAYAPQNFLMKTYEPMYRRFCTGVDGVDTLRDIVRKNPSKIVKINLYNRSPQMRERCRESLQDLPINYAYAEKTSFEVSADGVTKATGIKFLCDYLHIGTEDAVAIGDAPNDKEMLQTVGLGVAMGNATDEIKKLAAAVTLTCDENGVLAAIKKYF